MKMFLTFGMEFPVEWNVFFSPFVISLFLLYEMSIEYQLSINCLHAIDFVAIIVVCTMRVTFLYGVAIENQQ